MKKLSSNCTAVIRRSVAILAAVSVTVVVASASYADGPRDHDTPFLENEYWTAGSTRSDGDLILVDSSPVIGEFSVDVQLAQATDDSNDPLEPLNRAIFGFNDIVYDVLLGPLSDAYGFLPAEIRTIIGSILANLRAPVILFNDILQGEPERALDTFARFAINSTFGFAGMADVASSAGFEKHDEDFGQTMAVWGVGEGFYLVLPLLGPSNPRDAVGKFVVDPLIDPFSNYLDNTDQEDWDYARIGVTAIDEFSSVQSELENIKKTSIDYYAAVRSLYRQRRAAEIGNGDDLNLPPIPDFDIGGDDVFPDGTEPATVPSPTVDDQQISSLTDISVGTSSVPDIEMAADQALWHDPLGARLSRLLQCP